MSNTILLKRSAVANAVPGTGNLALGELAINTYDGKLFTKIDNGVVSVVDLTQNQTITLSGNLTGSGSNSIVATLTTTGVTANTYGGSGAIPSFTVDEYGRITAASNVAISSSGISNGTSNVDIATSGGNVTTSVGGNANVLVVTGTGANVAGYLGVTGNITAGNVSGGNLVSATYLSGDGYLISNLSVGAGSEILNGNSNVSVAADGNVTIGVTGTSAVATFTATGANISGYLDVTGNANVGNIGGTNAVFTDIAGTLTTAAQTNITSLGTLTSLDVTGNVIAGNLNSNAAVTGITGVFSGNVVAGNISTSGSGGNISGANVVSATTFTATANVTGGNLNSNAAVTGVTGVFSGNVTANYFFGNGSQLTGLNTSGISNGTSNISIPVANGNVNTAAGGNITLVVTDTGANITGTLNSTGNANVANIGATNAVFTNIAGTLTTASQTNITAVGTLTSLDVTGNVIAGNLNSNAAVTGVTGSFTGNVSTGNVSGTNGTFTNVAGTLTTASQTNITSVGTLTSLDVTGNILGGNLNSNAAVTGVTGSFTGNVSTGNVSGTNGTFTNVAGTLTTASQTNITSVGTLTSLDVTGNVIAGNLNSNAAVTGVTVVATGNINGGNVNSNVFNGTGVTIKSTGDLNLEPTGNIVLGNRYINGVAEPQQASDAATKQYVDNFATTGITFHQPVLAATYTTLAAETGGTITYTQPNGVGNGVGATLTTTGAFTVIDTANVQTVGTRILVKDQGNAVQNGIYVWANSTAIVRSTDADEYGADSTTQISINDYFFTQSGNVNKGTAFIVNAPAGTITFGNSNISFAEFSSTQTYTANTSAGLVLNGTVFSAKVDNITTAFDGSGNIVVKSSANLTTPNIGDATGNSLTLTGNGLVSATTVNASGNVVGGNLNSNAAVTGTTFTSSDTISAAGQITSTGAGNTATGTGQFYLNGTTLNRIDYNTNGTGAPTFTTRSAGTKVTLYPSVTGATVDYALGIEAATMWSSVPENNDSFNFKWYGATTQVASLSGAGLFTTIGNIVAANLNSNAAVTGVTGVFSGNVSAGNANIIGTTISTSTTTGALTVAGGVGVAGNVYATDVFKNGVTVLNANDNIDGGTY